MLRVFNTVRDRGERRNEAYFWQGMTVSSDFDGYNLSLSDGHCHLTVHFHNKFTFDSPNRVLRQEFLDLLKRIDRLR